MRVYPSELGNAAGTHMSAYIVILKGKFDAILPWLFEKKISFTVVDRQESMAERQNITQSTTIPTTSVNGQRPKSDQNGGYGFAKFTSHEMLKMRKYICDDTLFLQVDVTDDE